MTTPLTIKEFIEHAAYSFSSQNFDFFEENMSDNAELILPEVNTLYAKTPKTHLIGKDKILAFWHGLHKIMEPQVSKTELLNINSEEIIRFYYDEIQLIMDAKFHFNADSLIQKMEFSIVKQ